MIQCNQATVHVNVHFAFSFGPNSEVALLSNRDNAFEFVWSASHVLCTMQDNEWNVRFNTVKELRNNGTCSVN